MRIDARNAAAAALLFLAAGCAVNAPAYDPVTMDPVAVDAQHPPAIEQMTFQSHGARLNGILYLADGAGPHPTVILLHGYPGNEKNLDLAQILRRGGFNVMFFHYRGAWGSEGDFSLTHVIEDVASASAMLRARAPDHRVDPDRILLVGHSMGGFAALEAAARDVQVRCVAGLAPADFAAGWRYFQDHPETAAQSRAYADSLQMLAGWSGAAMEAELAANEEAFSLTALAPALAGKSVLLIAAAEDADVPPALVHEPMVAAYQAQAGLALTQQVLPGDHSFSTQRIALSRAVLAWAQTCANGG